jgi:hypothetical protein
VAVASFLLEHEVVKRTERFAFRLRLECEEDGTFVFQFANVRKNGTQFRGLLRHVSTQFDGA